MSIPRVEQLPEFRRHAEWALAVGIAVELELPAALGGTPRSAEEVARELGLEARGTRILLGVLVALELVAEEGGGFRLTRPGRAALLDRDDPAYQRAQLRLWTRNLRAWTGHLAEAVRTGRPAPDDPADGADQQAGLAGFMAAMDAKPAGQVRALVTACLDRVPDASSMLDLGGGPGTFARTFAARGVRSTLFDRPEVIDHVAGEYGLRDAPGVELMAGDFLEEPPAGSWDIVLLANVTHLFDPSTNRAIIGALASRVTPGGILAILDFVRGASPFAPLFAITMLLRTERGETHPEESYREWMARSGLEDVEMVSIDTDRQLVSARRPRGLPARAGGT